MSMIFLILKMYIIKIIKIYNDTDIIDNIIGEVEIIEFNSPIEQGIEQNLYIDYTITRTIDYNLNTYLIVSIGDNSFINSNLSGSLTIPGNIKKIGKLAFFSCNDLNKLTY